MSITYTWNVQDLERESDTGVVTVVHWSCSGVHAETGTVRRSYGTVNLPTSDPESDGFVEFAGLTESAVIKWLWDLPDHKHSTEQGIADQIDSVTNPTISKGMPW